MCILVVILSNSFYINCFWWFWIENHIIIRHCLNFYDRKKYSLEFASNMYRIDLCITSGLNKAAENGIPPMIIADWVGVSPSHLKYSGMYGNKLPDAKIKQNSISILPVKLEIVFFKVYLSPKLFDFFISTFPVNNSHCSTTPLAYMSKRRTLV